MKVLVTGGSGLVGHSLQKYVKNNKDNLLFNFIFINSKQYNLTNIDDIYIMLNNYKLIVSYI